MQSVVEKPRVAGYEIASELGENAWGRSFRAKQVSLDRWVHLTILSPDASRGTIGLARACAAVTHPHLISGIDFGECEAGLFLVTEWVEGRTLTDLVGEEGRLAEDRSVRIAHSLAQALAYAAKKGVIHGNLTPDAVLIMAGDSPKLRGFGADRDFVARNPQYLSPEALQHRATDVRSDIYSLGAVLFYMLTAKQPMDEALPSEVVNGEVVEAPLSQALGSVAADAQTREVLDKMTAADADDRFVNGPDLVAALESLQSKLDERVSIQRRRPGGRHPRTARIHRRRRR